MFYSFRSFIYLFFHARIHFSGVTSKLEGVIEHLLEKWLVKRLNRNKEKIKVAN